MISNGMSGIICAICVALVYYIINYLKERKSEKEMEEASSADSTTAEGEGNSEQQPSATMTSELSNKEFILSALRSLQCSPVVEEEKDGHCSIAFEYQAERFTFTVSESSKFCTLYDAFWYSFENKDIDQLSHAKRVINELNWNSQLNLCYNITDDNMVNIHTVLTMLCHEGTEFTFTDYLRHILRECFILHHEFFRRLTLASSEK